MKQIKQPNPEPHPADELGPDDPIEVAGHSSLAPAPRVDLDADTLFRLVVDGDCSKLSQDQRLLYYRARCDAAGVDYRTQPFQFLNLNGKLVLYALKGCTDQLAANHGIVCQIVDQRTEDGIRTVTVRAQARDGRQTDEIGCVSVAGLKGDAACNAYMKAVTKSKRRAVLSLCGLGLLDESEIETIPGARPELKQLQGPSGAEEPGATDLPPAPPPAAPPPPRPAQSPKVKRLWAAVRERQIALSLDKGTTDRIAKAVLGSEGYEHTEDVPAGQIDALIEKIKQALEDAAADLPEEE